MKQKVYDTVMSVLYEGLHRNAPLFWRWGGPKLYLLYSPRQPPKGSIPDLYLQYNIFALYYIIM